MIRLFLLLSLPLYILDQLTKSWIVANFRLYETEQEVIPGIFWLHHAANTGVAFGMFNGTAVCELRLHRRLARRAHVHLCDASQRRCSPAK
jgi:lipoprotein signal peptidase